MRRSADSSLPVTRFVRVPIRDPRLIDANVRESTERKRTKPEP